MDILDEVKSCLSSSKARLIRSIKPRQFCNQALEYQSFSAWDAVTDVGLPVSHAIKTYKARVYVILITDRPDYRPTHRLQSLINHDTSMSCDACCPAVEYAESASAPSYHPSDSPKHRTNPSDTPQCHQNE